jgi:hypothetical protein
MPLPADAGRDLEWVKEAPREKNLIKRIEIVVPTEPRRSASRFLLLPRADAEKAVLRVHYGKAGYGGEVYWVPIGRFLSAAEKG